MVERGLNPPVAAELDDLALPALVDAWGAQVRPHAEFDPRREFDMETFDNAMADVRGHAGERAAEIRAQLQ